MSRALRNRGLRRRSWWIRGMHPAAAWGLALCASVSSVHALEPSQVDAHAISAQGQPEDTWLAYGRTYGAQRFSPLKQINTGNVSRIGEAWEADLESPRFGIEATPLEVGGVLYVTSSYSRVFAFDARTGKRLWFFDPHVPPDWLPNGCCKPMNRGVALSRGKVFVGTYDGRLIALDASSGKKVWEVNTTGSSKLYTITGAPLSLDDEVIIGNGGGDFATRGYLSAYDVATGAMKWRFYTVPGDPKKGFETPDVAKAAKTWRADRDWSLGGDGSPWNALSYDEKRDLLYVGTGNGPGEDQPKSNLGGGDNLFTCSILAIHAHSGRLAWYYQTTPGDLWDYDAVQDLILADIPWHGHPRAVLMQANKNGFFYVLDRATGELLAADPFAQVNWARRIDLKTGKPEVIAENTDWRAGMKLLFPGEYGAHNWMAMAFSPMTRYAYYPAEDIGWIEGADQPGTFYLGYDVSKLPAGELAKHTHGALIAWDVAHRRPAWSATYGSIINGGVLVTAGNLVIQGTADGHLHFYDAEDGRLKHSLFIGTGIVAAPMSYALQGEQYIAFGAGWNGWNTEAPKAADPPPYDNAGRLIVLKLDGPPVKVAARLPPPRPFLIVHETADPAKIAAGKKVYDAQCSGCHTVYGEGSVYPDLRRMSKETYDSFFAIVLGGARHERGMASFASEISPADAEAIRAYLTDWARRSQAASACDPTAGSCTKK